MDNTVGIIVGRIAVKSRSHIFALRLLLPLLLTLLSCMPILCALMYTRPSCGERSGLYTSSVPSVTESRAPSGKPCCCPPYTHSCETRADREAGGERWPHHLADLRVLPERRPSPDIVDPVRSPVPVRGVRAGPVHRRPVMEHNAALPDGSDHLFVGWCQLSDFDNAAAGTEAVRHDAEDVAPAQVTQRTLKKRQARAIITEAAMGSSSTSNRRWSSPAGRTF
eukprot:SAG31_NODE_816_length_11865_cov_38.805116_12_plen_223_part_00